MIKNFTITSKKNLTNDVFEIEFKTEEKIDFIYGQFITFILPGIGGRAYSILDAKEKKITLIIKRLENGRGGSKFICDGKIGDILKGVGPAGHFILKENKKNKLFIGTGTGFVPLYNQINGSISKNQNCKLKLIFGVRNENDVFYENELIKINENYKNFEFEYFISKEHNLGHNFGRVTDYLTKENIIDFEEFYICGNPYMIEDAINILEKLGIEKENINTEKF